MNQAGTPYTNSPGNWRFENVTRFGAIVPEPSVLARLGVGISSLVLIQRRKAQ